MLVAFILVYLLVTILIGRWAAQRVKSASDFMVAGRSLPLGISTCVIFATWFGSETMLGATSEFAQHGLQGVMEDPFGASLCLLLVGLFYARKLYRSNVLTFCDYFKIRFGKKAEVMGIPSSIAMLASGLLVMAYTYMGGMWSVSITDFIQTIMIIIGILVITYNVIDHAGGLQTVIDKAPPGTFQFFPHNDWNSWLKYMAAWFTIGLGSIPQQDVFQRLMSSKSEKVAQYSSYLGALMYLVIGSLPLLIVLCAQQLYPAIATGDTEKILPNMVLQHGSLFTQVLFFGALLSAIMSTTSGAILAPSTVLGENIIRPFFKDIPDAKFLRIIRLSVVIVSIISMLMAFGSQNIYELVASSSVLSLVSLFVPLTAGLYWKRSNEAGAILSIIMGTAGYIFSEVSETETPPLFVGLLSSIAGMIIGTYGWKKKDATPSASSYSSSPV
jgi:Na+/proline symporter